MKKILMVVFAMMLLFVLSGCESNIENVIVAEGDVADQEVVDQEVVDQEVIEEARLSIITSLYPQYDFTKSIVGDKADVILILPPGVESHSFEPTPQDMVKLQNSDLFLYTGKEMEPWAYRLTGSISAKIVDLSAGIALMDLDDHGHEDDHDHEEEDHEELMDPHIWTDPNLAIVMVDNILVSLKAIDETNADYYEENANALKNALMELDLEIKDVLSKTTSKTILSGGHFAFGYFVERYGLNHMSPYEGFSPDAEPTPKRIAALIETIKETDAKAIFYEELIDPKVSRVISEETGIEMLLLHGAHNVTKEEFEAGKSYITFMKENLERLKIGLGYDE